MRLTNDWKDYILLDAGNGEKLESWNGVILRRPDPQAMWPTFEKKIWKNVDGFYHRSDKGGGYWDFYKKLDDYWTVDYGSISPPRDNAIVSDEKWITYELLEKPVQETGKEDREQHRLLHRRGAPHGRRR